MGDLDTELKKLRNEWSQSGYYDLVEGRADEFEAAIKQAFKDAGWIDAKQAKALTDVKKHLKGCVTGQEWLSKFEFELSNLVFETWYERDKPDETHEVLNRELILKAARKAAGITS